MSIVRNVPRENETATSAATAAAAAGNEVLENASLTERRNFRETARVALLGAQCAISEIPDEYISVIDHYEAAARADIPVMVYRSNNRQHAQ